MLDNYYYPLALCDNGTYGAVWGQLKSVGTVGEYQMLDN